MNDLLIKVAILKLVKAQDSSSMKTDMFKKYFILSKVTLLEEMVGVRTLEGPLDWETLFGFGS